MTNSNEYLYKYTRTANPTQARGYPYRKSSGIAHNAKLDQIERIRAINWLPHKPTTPYNLPLSTRYR